MKASCILCCIPNNAGRSREGILCLRYSPSRPPSRAWVSGWGDHDGWQTAKLRGSAAGGFQGLRPPWPRPAAHDPDMAALPAGSRPRAAPAKDGGSAHAPWLPRLPPPLYGRPRRCLGALWHGRLCGGAARCTPGRWRKRRVTWPRAARRQRLGAVRSRPSGASAGPAPPPRHLRPAPLRGWEPGGCGGKREARREGRRRRCLGRPLGGGTAGTGPRPLGRGGHSLGRRLGPGRGVERTSGLGAVLARPARFVSRWGAEGPIPPPRREGRERPRGRRGEPVARPGPGAARSFAGARRCSPGPAALDCGWDFYFCTSGKPITLGNAIYCDKEVIVFSVDWRGHLKTRVGRSCVK